MGEDKPNSQLLCYICGKPGANSKDDIPPKNLFGPGDRENLIKVPAHIDCNRSFSKDDEHFRLSLMIPGFWESEKARKLWEDRVVGSIHRPESKGFKTAILQRVIPVEVRYPYGLILGNAEAMMLDAKRIERVISRTVRGLYYHHTRNILPLDWPIKPNWMRPEIQQHRQPDSVRSRFVDVGNGTFRYWWRSLPEDDRIGLFWLVFYDCIDYWVFTGRQDR